MITVKGKASGDIYITAATTRLVCEAECAEAYVTLEAASEIRMRNVKGEAYLDVLGKPSLDYHCEGEVYLTGDYGAIKLRGDYDYFSLEYEASAESIDARGSFESFGLQSYVTVGPVYIFGPVNDLYFDEDDDIESVVLNGRQL